MKKEKVHNKRALMLASVASMIDQFNIPNIRMLQSLGYVVDVAADFTNPGTITNDRAENLKKRLDEMEVRVFDVAIPRSLNPGTILLAYKKVKKLIYKRNYTLIHCHSPIGGAVCRLAVRKARKTGIRVIYTAHGFHFFKGAPLKNWLLFFPIEWICSHWTDVLITINKEDYKRAKENFHAREIVYIPGVGVDTEKFGSHYNRDETRRELGIPEEALLLVSVGELNRNKNHSVVIRAVAKLKNVNIHYAIAGKGLLRDELKALAESLNVGKQVHFLGFRSDIPELYSAADICIFSSIREGLGLAAIEGMASGLPLIVSDNRGTREFQAEDTAITCRYDDVNGFAKAILRLAKDPALRKKMGDANRMKSADFDISVIAPKMTKLYEEGALK